VLVLHEDRILKSPIFQQYIRQKTRLIIYATSIFLIGYFFLPVLIALAPHIVNRTVYRSLTVGWMIAFMQFVMAWAIAAVYWYKAKQLDRLLAQVKIERCER
jgi:uncharacterized membrane protein (DUF485 family)